MLLEGRGEGLTLLPWRLGCIAFLGLAWRVCKMYYCGRSKILKMMGALHFSQLSQGGSLQSITRFYGTASRRISEPLEPQLLESRAAAFTRCMRAIFHDHDTATTSSTATRPTAAARPRVLQCQCHWPSPQDSDKMGSRRLGGKTLRPVVEANKERMFTDAFGRSRSIVVRGDEHQFVSRRPWTMVVAIAIAIATVAIYRIACPMRLPSPPASPPSHGRPDHTETIATRCCV